MSGQLRQQKPNIHHADPGGKYAEIEALAAKAALGDKNALYSLCEKLAGSIFFRAKCMLGNEMDAEDVTQNVLLRMCESIHALREAKAFRAWVCGIEINETRRFVAQHARHGEIVNIEDYLELLCENHADRLPQAYMEYQGLNNEVMEIISHLPVRQREAVMLHYYDEMNINEVAHVMGISHQNASKYLALARKKIKTELEKAPGIERISAITYLPMSALVSDTFQVSAADAGSVSAPWVQGALAMCQQCVFETSAEMAAVTAGALESAVAAFRLSYAAIMGSLSMFFINVQ